jgi:hypothetical protein
VRECYLWVPHPSCQYLSTNACHRQHSNTATDNITSLVNSCVPRDQTLCLQSVGLPTVAHRASENGDDDYDDDNDSKDSFHRATQSQNSTLTLSPHPHCLCLHNFFSRTSTPLLPSQAQTVHGCMDRNTPLYRNLSKPSITELKFSWFQTFAVFSMLYVFFWVIPRRLNFICRRFGTLCLSYFPAKPSLIPIPQLFSNIVIINLLV